MIRKFSNNEKPLKYSHCPKCDAGPKRLCDINSLTSDTTMVSPFMVLVSQDEKGNFEEKSCTECGYTFPKKYRNTIDEKIKVSLK